MIPDKVKLALTSPEPISLLFIILFFAAETIMLFEFPYLFWWIPLLSVALRISLVSYFPYEILCYNMFVHFIFISTASYVGYGILMYFAPSTIISALIIMLVICGILILQASGIQENIYLAILQRIADSDELWQVCKEIEKEDSVEKEK